MFFTSIIPTVGREILRRAVQSVLDQHFSHEAYEVIAVNDSGTLLSKDDFISSHESDVLAPRHAER